MNIFRHSLPGPFASGQHPQTRPTGPSVESRAVLFVSAWAVGSKKGALAAFLYVRSVGFSPGVANCQGICVALIPAICPSQRQVQCPQEARAGAGAQWAPVQMHRAC